MKASLILVLGYLIVNSKLNLFLNDLIMRFHDNHFFLSFFLGVFFIAVIGSYYKQIIRWYIINIMKSKYSKYMFMITFVWLFMLRGNV